MEESREDYILLGASFILGLLFNYLFFDKAFGISYPIFICFVYGFLYYGLREKLASAPGFGTLLTIPVALLAATYFIFSNIIFEALNFIAIPFLLLVQTLLVSRRNTASWFSPRIIQDILHAIFIRVPTNLPQPFKMLSKLVSKKGEDKYPNVKKILIGLAISAPLLMIVISLLVSADRVFEYYLSEFTGIFRDINAGELISRGLLTAVVTLVMFCYVWSLKYKETVVGAAGETAAAKEPRTWDPVIVLTVFICVNTVYLLFTAVQFSYLFGGLNLQLPSQFTYSEYARRGFFELIAVTLINFALLLSCLKLTKTGSAALHTANRALYSLLVACTAVMLVSAHIRMSMYEQAYGYTYLRVLTHSFMAFLLALFLITLYGIWKEGAVLMKPFIVTAAAAYLIVNYMNIDAVIVAKNIERYRESGVIDVQYLTTLSDDAVPALAALSDDGDPKVAAEVKEYLGRKKASLEAPQPWPSFNLSRYVALKALQR